MIEVRSVFERYLCVSLFLFLFASLLPSVPSFPFPCTAAVLPSGNIRPSSWAPCRGWHGATSTLLPAERCRRIGDSNLGRTTSGSVCSFLVPHTLCPSAVRALSIDRAELESASEVPRVVASGFCQRGLAHLRTGRQGLELSAFSCMFNPSPLGGAVDAVPWRSVDCRRRRLNAELACIPVRAAF